MLIQNRRFTIKHFVLFCLISFLTAGSAFSQYKIPYQEEEKKDIIIWYLNSGPSIPISPSEFNELWRTGFSLGFGVGKVLNPNTILQIYLNYNRFPTDEFGILEQLGLENTHTLSGGTTRILQFSMNVKWNIINKVMAGGPFLVGGTGVLRWSREESIASGIGAPTFKEDGARDIALSLSFGGGLDIPIGGNTYIFVELKYTIGLTDDGVNYMPVKIGFMW